MDGPCTTDALKTVSKKAIEKEKLQQLVIWFAITLLIKLQKSPEIHHRIFHT